MSYDQLKKRIRELLAANQGTAIRVPELLEAIGLPQSERKRLRRILREMAEEGGPHAPVRMRGRAVASASRNNEAHGTLRTSGKGFGFLRVDPDDIAAGKPDTVFIPRKYMADAMNGDRVRVRLLGETAKLPEGQVLEVTERACSKIVGTFYHTRKGGYVAPRDERITRSIATPKPDPEMNLQNGDYVLVQIDDWTSSSEELLGTVLERLGDDTTQGIDITVIIHDHDVDPEFLPQTLEEAAAVSEQISQEEINRRLDLRELTTFTIDGPTAKDFDDALSIDPQFDGTWKLGVHIADVSHYVREGTYLDIDARDRGTSIYPVDRVVPMLPPKLSDNICSLRPNEDRLVLSVFMTIDETGRVWDYSIHNAIIRSSHRLIYEDVQAVMDHTASAETVRAIGGLRNRFEELYALRKALTNMRMKRGALDLDMVEIGVEIDENNRPAAIVPRARLDSHRVVEECMLIANEVVACHLWNLHLPCVYRVHEEPDQEKLKSLMPILNYLGLKFPGRGDVEPKTLQTALDTSTKFEHGFIARRLLLRSMMQARYSPENLGHFGLASKCYCHFTSPIRRYPDLMVHRITKEAIAAGLPHKGMYAPPGELPPEHGVARPTATGYDKMATLPADRQQLLEQTLGDIARISSERERRAEQIEREATQVKIVEYMQRHLGDEFEGIVTTTLPHGFFVQLDEIPVEGFVPLRTLVDDYYEFDEDRMLLQGRTTGTIIKLADKVTVAVQSANISKREIDLTLLKHDPSELKIPEDKRVRTKNIEKKPRRHVEHKPRHGFKTRGKQRRR